MKFSVPLSKSNSEAIALGAKTQWNIVLICLLWETG